MNRHLPHKKGTRNQHFFFVQKEILYTLSKSLVKRKIKEVMERKTINRVGFRSLPVQNLVDDDCNFQFIIDARRSYPIFVY